MTRCHDERPVMDDDLLSGCPRRDWLAGQASADRIEVVAVDHKAFGVDRPVDDFGGLERTRRQGDQVRLLLGVPVQGTCLGLAMDVNVRDLGQLPGGCLVLVRQRVEVAAPQQAGFGISKGPFHLSLGLGPSHPAGDRPKSIVGCECQESRVVDWLVAVVACDERPYMVPKQHSDTTTSRCAKAQMCWRMVVAKS